MRIQKVQRAQTDCKSGTVLFTRINEIIELIPEDFPKRNSLVHDLKDRQGSIAYTAPERISGRWIEVGSLLGDYIPADTELGEKVAALFQAAI